VRRTACSAACGSLRSFGESLSRAQIHPNFHVRMHRPVPQTCDTGRPLAPPLHCFGSSLSRPSQFHTYLQGGICLGVALFQRLCETIHGFSVILAGQPLPFHTSAKFSLCHCVSFSASPGSATLPSRCHEHIGCRPQCRMLSLCEAQERQKVSMPKSSPFIPKD